MHLGTLLGFTAVDTPRKKQLPIFTLWGFSVAALAFRILRKNVRLRCANVRVAKKTHFKVNLSCGNAGCCEASDSIQSRRRVSLRDELWGNKGETPHLYLFSLFKKTHQGKVLTCRVSLALRKEATREGRGRRHCSHIRNPCGCWGQGKHSGWGQHLPAARQSLGLRRGARTASLSFPCNGCRFGRKHLLCSMSVSWLCA